MDFYLILSFLSILSYQPDLIFLPLQSLLLLLHMVSVVMVLFNYNSFMLKCRHQLFKLFQKSSLLTKLFCPPQQMDVEKPEWSVENMYQVFSFFSRPLLEQLPEVKNRRLLYFLNRNFACAPYRVFRTLAIRINSCGVQLVCCIYYNEDGLTVSYQWLSTYKSIWFRFVNISLAPIFNGDQSHICNQLNSLNRYWKNKNLSVSLLPYEGLDGVSSIEQERYEDLLDQILRSSNIMTCRDLSIRMKWGKIGSPLHSYPLLHRRKQLTLTHLDWSVLEQVVDYLQAKEIFDSKVIIVLDCKHPITANLLLQIAKKRFTEATRTCPYTFFCKVGASSDEFILTDCEDNYATQERLQIGISKEPAHQEKYTVTYVVQRFSLK